jgi:supervillin
MEPVLFREKFFDWPDKSGLIRVKNQDSDDNKTASGGGGGGNDISSLEPYDAQLMLDYELEDPDLELEGAHLGRGVEYYDPAERRLQQVRLFQKINWREKFEI